MVFMMNEKCNRVAHIAPILALWPSFIYATIHEATYGSVFLVCYLPYVTAREWSRYGPNHAVTNKYIPEIVTTQHTRNAHSALARNKIKPNGYPKMKKWMKRF